MVFLTAFFTVMNKLITLFLYIIVGYAIRKKNVVSEKFESELIKFLMSISLPALVINTFQTSYTPELLKRGAIIYGVSLIIYGASIVIGMASGKLLKIDKSAMGVWIFAVMFPNHCFMGWPVMSAVFGEDALFYAAFANLGFSTFAYTYGVYIISKYGENKNNKMSVKNMIVTPINVSILIGILMFVTHIALPSSVGSAVSGLGNLTTPLAMIYCGMLLTKNKFSEVFGDWRVYAVSVLRLIVIPLLVFAVAKIFIKDHMILAVLVVGHSMPVAGFCALFAGQYGGDAVLASKFIFVSTLLCIVSIPFISMLV